jgi:hypothetical protein
MWKLLQLKKMESCTFNNTACVRLCNESVELYVAKASGIRILGYNLLTGDNLFADVPEIYIPCPGNGDLKVVGGHRLWHAPQFPERTHLPDEKPVAIIEIKNGCMLKQETEAETGIQKSLKITFPDTSEKVSVEHILTNNSLWPIETAPWAITALKPGGVAILPQNTIETNKHGLVAPNRNITFWPFTDINNPKVQWGNRYIFVNTAMDDGQFKLGFPNPKEWLGYYHSGYLFVKQAAYFKDKPYFDNNSSSEFYCQNEFTELETLGPIRKILPGQSVSHTETWHLFKIDDFEISEDYIKDSVKALFKEVK